MVDENRDRQHVPAQQPDPIDRSMRNDSQRSSVRAEHGSELGRYRKLTTRVRSALRPVKPSAAFRQTLAQELTEVVRHRQHSDLCVASPSSQRELIIGAVIASAVAVAGGIIYVIRSHVQGRSQKANGAGA